MRKYLSAKRIVSGLRRRARGWLREEVDPFAVERARFSGFAYSQLNCALLKIMSEGAGGPLRQNYTWGVLHAAHLAKALGIDRISAIEFGVAGGSGLISLENGAQAVEKLLGVRIDVYGFDTGCGLPKPLDYRDLPNLYEESDYVMDQTELKRRLQKAELILGLIEKTLPGFIRSAPAPVGFVSVDVDLYSSTMSALRLFEADANILLPRVHCYFDDILGFTAADFNGERQAMHDFNASHEPRKISPIYGLHNFVPRSMANQMWVEMMYMTHILDHPLYGKNDGLVISRHLRLTRQENHLRPAPCGSRTIQS